MTETIRIFVGVSANHEDCESQCVLEHSIRKHASQPVEITWMRLSRDPSSPFYSNHEKGEGWQTELWTTPFSALRWGLAEICGFEGKAIYSDSDIIYFSDIADLWNQPMDGKVALAKEAGGTRFCVSLWDCAAAKPHIPPISKMQADPGSHRATTFYFRDHPEIVGAFKGSWNTHDKEPFNDLRTNPPKAFHYTTINSQFQLKYALPRLKEAGLSHWYDGKPIPHPRKDAVEVFDALLAEAIANGYTVDSYCQEPPFGTYRKRSLKRH